MGPEQTENNLTHEMNALRQRLFELEEVVRRSDQARHASEERFRLMANAAPVLIWMAGPDALYSFFNKTWLEFRGRTLEDEIGNGWTKGVHPDDVDSVLQKYLNAFYSRAPFQMEFRLLRHDGEYRWVETAGVPRFEPDASFAGFIGSGADIHDRKRPAWLLDEGAMKGVLSLTERERQVLMLIADGNSTKNAAEKLGISYKTADSHRSRILEKLGVHETASLVRYAIRAGLVQP
jgi:PAS domain S-box-containing protein